MESGQILIRSYDTIILAGVRPRLLCHRVGAEPDLHKLLAYRCQPERD